MIEFTTTTIDGLSITSTIQGSGKPVVLLHGWGGKIESMIMVADSLHLKGYQTHTLDLPGFGRSPLPPLSDSGEAWGVKDYAKLVVQYMDRHELTRVNFIGHSFGGRICIMIGAIYPDRVDKIVLTDSAGVLNPPSKRDSLVQLGKQALKLPGLNLIETRARAWARAQLGSEDYKMAGPLEPIFKQVIAEDLVPFAAKIAAPTLLIWGDQDQDTPLWHGQTLEKTIPDAGLVVFNGAGHYAYQERLPDFLRIVETFFKET